jgi:hypothetical protein
MTGLMGPPVSPKVIEPGNQKIRNENTENAPNTKRNVATKETRRLSTAGYYLFTMKRPNDSRCPFAIRSSYSSMWAGLILLSIVSLLQTLRLAERAVVSLNTAQDGRGLLSSRAPVASSSPLVELPDLLNSNGTIVVQLSGEMGNNLHKLAFGRGLQLMAKNDYNLELHLVLRHQNQPKWISAKRNLQKCFPSLKQLNFSAGNTKEYDDRRIEQKLWLGGKEAGGLNLKGNDEASMNEVLDQMQSILQSKLAPALEKNLRSKIRLPFVVADEMVDWHVLDRFRPELLEWLAFDYDACCPSSLPDPDESVFHFRNFVTELQGATSRLGFEELPAELTATELFGHLHSGDKVAITTRSDNDVTQQYVHAMEELGLKVRVIAGNSATEDFCFLAKAKKELVGGQRSSFFTWAAFFGTALDTGQSSTTPTNNDGGIQRVRSYAVNPPAQHQLNSKNSMQLPYEWEDERLKEKWTFDVYQTPDAT